MSQRTATHMKPKHNSKSGSLKAKGRGTHHPAGGQPNLGVAIRPSAEKECAGPYLDQREVARRLGLKPRTVGNWAREQKLPAYRFGRLLRFKWDEVESALAANFRVAAPPANEV